MIDNGSQAKAWATTRPDPVARPLGRDSVNGSRAEARATLFPRATSAKGKSRHYTVPGADCFLTTHTAGFAMLFLNPGAAELVRDTLREVAEALSIGLAGYAVLHHHVHLLVSPGGVSLSHLMFRFKGRASFRLNRLLVRSGPVWQDRFHDHIIRSQTDWNRHLDYIHFNPVKHGLVGRPEDWPWSSYREYQARGAYPEGWGHMDIEHLRGMDYENGVPG